MTTAPDGTMYITDMYRGIIQESQWSGRGTYLRRRIEQYQLDKVVRHGRIWRLTLRRHGGATARSRGCSTRRRRSWSRTGASERLVARHRAAVARAQAGQVGRAGAAATGARRAGNQLARIHALWTLEGLGALDAALVRKLMKDATRRCGMQAIRASETLYKAGDRTFAADYETLDADADVDVVMQALMTLEHVEGRRRA